MRIKTFVIGSMALFLSCLGIATYQTLNSNNLVIIKATNNRYSCANINFGSNAQVGVFMPNTLKAYTFETKTINSELDKYVSDYQGITITSSTITKVYYGSADTHNYAIKFGANGVVGNLTLNFAEQICGCSVYALSYNTDNAIMVVNNNETELLSYAPTYTKANATELNYDRYDYTFAPTNTLEIKSKYGRVGSVSRSRFYICNIVLRVVV